LWKVKLIHIPTVLGAVVPIFNVTGSSDLRFSPDVLADIYLQDHHLERSAHCQGQSRRESCPATRSSLFHRSDGSGTTFIWTDYLSKVSPDWASGPGKGTAINWPTGVGGKGNEGVAAQVREFPGAIGYVELIYALQNHIDFGAIRNASGNWVKASIHGVTAAAATAKIPADYRVSITNAPGPIPIPSPASPICSFPLILRIWRRKRSSRIC
jgi:phosphate transport system substrate-binding protein